jgi:uncharacterized protein (TIGR02145 family)
MHEMKLKINTGIYSIVLLGAFLMHIASCKKEYKPSDPLTDIDGNVYKTIKVGDQIWMAENLKVTHYRNGDPIPNSDSAWNLGIGAYCDYNNIIPQYSEIYGRLYNFNAVNDYRNLAPEGWHVATQTEWMTLVYKFGDELFAGRKLKEKGTTHWAEPNEGATNESGFTALPGGARGLYFSQIDSTGYWWTSGPYAYYFTIYYNQNVAWCSISWGHVGGYSVRCVKD